MVLLKKTILCADNSTGTNRCSTVSFYIALLKDTYICMHSSLFNSVGSLFRQLNTDSFFLRCRYHSNLRLPLIYPHPYRQITVETEFDNPLYETGGVSFIIFYSTHIALNHTDAVLLIFFLILIGNS